jgi:hypothetical protein
VEAVLKPEGGKGAEKTGKTEADFDAAGFAPGCDPKTPPAFDVTKGDALVAHREREKDHDDHDRKDEKPRSAAKPKPGAVDLPPPPPPLPPPPAKPDFNP